MTSTAVIRSVIKRDGGRCVIAGKHCLGEATLADHRANRGYGGSEILDNPANLIAACVLCNGLKEDASGTYRAQLVARGIRVEKAATNEATLSRCLLIAVHYPDGSVWWLTRDGRRVADSIPPF